MARYSDNYELTSELSESYHNADHSVPVSLKNTNSSLSKFRLAIREHEPEIDEQKKQRLLNTAFQGRGRLSTHKRKLIKKGR